MALLLIQDLSSSETEQAARDGKKPAVPLWRCFLAVLPSETEQAARDQKEPGVASGAGISFFRAHMCPFYTDARVIRRAIQGGKTRDFQSMGPRAHLRASIAKSEVADRNLSQFHDTT